MLINQCALIIYKFTPDGQILNVKIQSDSIKICHNDMHYLKISMSTQSFSISRYLERVENEFTANPFIITKRKLIGGRKKNCQIRSAD